IKYVVLGIGIDVNLSTAEFPPELRAQATSLALESGNPIPRAGLAVEVLRELDADYDRLVSGQFSAVTEEWQAHCATLGQEVVIAAGPRQLRGRAEALGDDGALLLRTEHGHLERIMGGDVT